MRVTFVRPDLHHFDEVAAEAIALGVFEDERPLRGAAGLVDWRLNGALTRWIATRRFRGAEGETLLYPDRGRLTFGRVLVRGLGLRADWDEGGWRAANVGLLRSLRALGIVRFAVALAGTDALALNIRQATERWLGIVRDVYLDESARPVRPDILLIASPETVRSVADVVQTFLKRIARNRGWS